MDQAQTFTVARVAAVAALLHIQKHHRKNKGKSPCTRRNKRTRHRNRLTIDELHESLGDAYFRRAFRMTFDSFKKLATTLRPAIKEQTKTNHESAPYIHNGRVLEDVRLGCALRYFAGGSPLDIMSVFGISHTEVLNSIWYVVQAINTFDAFAIKYPVCRIKQQQIADNFKELSQANFECCAGAIDGILIWIHRPCVADCQSSLVDSNKFFCGRKHKFGLNCQAISDSRGRILDLSIMFPGSTSDCLAFEGSAIFHSLENGLLAPGLCLFGDNAYINSPFMATPYTGALRGAKDAYNFYHSQLRIRVECTFGMLTERWGILRSAIPKNITIQRTIAIVCCLARLHNFCIDEADNEILELTANDDLHLANNGAVPMIQQVGTPQRLPTQLLNAGQHFDDVPKNNRRQIAREYARQGNRLPREVMYDEILTKGLTRPTR